MKALIQKFVQHSVRGIEAVPARDRADLFEALSLLLREHSPDVSKDALLAAEAIREAEAAQLHFHNRLEAQA